MFYTKWLLNMLIFFYQLGKIHMDKKKNYFFSGNKTIDKRFEANLKGPFFGWVLQHIFCFFLFFSISAWKTLKMNISTSFWSVQHPNAGQNIQHELNLLPSSFLLSPHSNECLLLSFVLLCRHNDFFKQLPHPNPSF